MLPLFRLFPAARYLDAANLLTCANVSLAIASIACATAGRNGLCAFILFLAALLDYVDGHVARTFLAERQANREFGKQLDTLADLLNFGVVPAVAMISNGHGVIAIVSASALVLSSVLRLAHFSVITVPGGYTGIPTTYTGFLFANLLALTASGRLPAASLPAAAGTCAVLQILDFHVRKLPAPTIVAAMSLIFSFTALFSLYWDGTLFT